MKAYFAKFASWGHGSPREQMWVFSKFRRYCDLLIQILIGQIWIYLGRSSMYLSTYLMFNFIWINIGFQCISAHTDLKTCNVQVGQWGAIILSGLQKKRKPLDIICVRSSFLHISQKSQKFRQIKCLRLTSNNVEISVFAFVIRMRRLITRVLVVR